MASIGYLKTELAAARTDEKPPFAGSSISTFPAAWSMLSIPSEPGQGMSPGEPRRSLQPCYVPMGAAAAAAAPSDYTHQLQFQHHSTNGMGQGLPLYPLDPATTAVRSTTSFRNAAAAISTLPYHPAYPTAEVTDNSVPVSEEGTLQDNPDNTIISSRYLIQQKIVVGHPLQEIDTRSLSAKRVLFYFGVLTLKEPCLQPKFEYTRDRSGMWTVKLVLYRESISIPRMQTRMVAKVEICRVALSLLKPRFSAWRVPDEPGLDLTAPEWSWGKMLEDYTHVNQLPCPVYTRYIHKNGYRYEVDVGSVVCYGVCKYYRTDADAADAAAHQVLYQLLTKGCDELALSVPGPVKREPSTSRTLAKTVAASTKETMHGIDTKNPDTKSQGRRQQKQQRKRRRRVVSNLIPVQNARIAPPPEHNDEPEPQSKWKITRHDLLKELRPLGTWTEKVDKMCQLLHLIPIFTIESVPVTIPTTHPDAKTHSAWATFPDDPYLSRAGIIGKVEGIETGGIEAKEACCRRMYDYLMELVDQDTALEAEERAGREFIRNFGEIKRQRLEAGRWNVSMQELNH